MLGIELHATRQETGPLGVDPAFLASVDLHRCAVFLGLILARYTLWFPCFGPQIFFVTSLCTLKAMLHWRPSLVVVALVPFY